MKCQFHHFLNKQFRTKNLIIKKVAFEKLTFRKLSDIYRQVDQLLTVGEVFHWVVI